MAEEQTEEVGSQSSEDTMSPLQKTVFGLVLIAILALAGILVSGNKPAQQMANQDEIEVVQTAEPTVAPESEEVMTETTQELIIEDTVIGDGPEVVAGDTVTVNYTGTLVDGTQFDSSLDEGRTPFTFKVGEGSVIEGWEVGLVGMQVGGTRLLTIPSAMAYGEAGSPPVIPPNSTLIFEIELLAIES